MTRLDYERIAALYGLDPFVVMGLIDKESSGNPWAWNPEPRYRYFWNVHTKTPFRVLKEAEIGMKTPPPDFPSLAGDRDQEWWGQQVSWGLMQIMGAVAREGGFRGPYLPELCHEELNVNYGCAHLAKLVAYMRRQYKGLSSHAEAKILLSALAAYNGGIGGNRPDDVPGRNRLYALDVVARANRIRAQYV